MLDRDVQRMLAHNSRVITRGLFVMKFAFDYAGRSALVSLLQYPIRKLKD